jgi:hypothetical protein
MAHTWITQTNLTTIQTHATHNPHDSATIETAADSTAAGTVRRPISNTLIHVKLNAKNVTRDAPCSRVVR